MTTAKLRAAASVACQRADFYRAARFLDEALRRYPGGPASPGTPAHRDQTQMRKSADTCRMMNSTAGIAAR